MEHMNVKALLKKYSGQNHLEFVKEVVLYVKKINKVSIPEICVFADFKDGTSSRQFGRKPGKGAKQSFLVPFSTEETSAVNPVQTIRFIIEGFTASDETIEFLEKLRDQAAAEVNAAGSDTRLITTNQIKKTVEININDKSSRNSFSAQVKYGIFAAGCKSIKLLSDIDLFATSRMPVLITGETGCGKELVANALHIGSARDGRFLAINCAAIPKDLIESELFGHAKGAYTGAINRKDGYFHTAHNGTLFLDEIGELDLDLQAKLLRVLQEKKVCRIGSSNVEEKVDVRIVAATNRNLKEMVKAGEFREDLYYRLNGLVLTVSPLRERPEEINPLIKYLLDKLSSELGSEITITREAVNKLSEHDFPGNVRELVNLLEAGAVIAGNPCRIEPHHLRIGGEIEEPAAVDYYSTVNIAPVPHSESVGHSNSIEREQIDNFSPDEKLIEMFWGKDFDEMQEIFNKVIFTHALKRSKGKIKGAAQMIGMERTTFSRAVKKMQLLETDEDGRREVVELSDSLEDFERSFNLNSGRGQSSQNRSAVLAA